MKYISSVILFFELVLINGCISSFIPETTEKKESLVVDGLITDQPGPYEVIVTKTMALGKVTAPDPVPMCIVSITDDEGHKELLHEATQGHYLTSPSFVGVPGKKYFLEIITPPAFAGTTKVYRSYPMELKAVPPIDSLYYEKTIIQERTGSSSKKEGAQVYIDSYDASGTCNLFRWDYVETWEFHLPFPAPKNKVCWITKKSDEINIKSTSALSENRIARYPLEFISNQSDRLSVKYSVLVNQYALNEDEFAYWEKMKNIYDNIGTLYDVIPSSVIGNVYCVDDPGEKVLGYFSVSGESSKRLFITEFFSGIVALYMNCQPDTARAGDIIPGLDLWNWIIEDYSLTLGYVVYTSHRDCADCTTRGSTVKPDFWDEGK
jgi:hypothetical protein